MLALLAAAELLLPYSGPLGIYSASDRVTRWSLRPGYRGVGPNLPDVALSYTMQVNNLGLRGGPLALPKPAGVIRIAALGDSVTFGFGVSEEETYPARVASLLAADVAPKRTDWVNAGVPGFSILQGLGQLDKRVLPTRPDIVVVLFGWNDGWRATTPDSAWWPGKLEALIPSSRLFAFAQRHAEPLMCRFGPRTGEDTRPMTPRVPVPDFEQNLRDITAHVRGAGATPILVTAPAAFGPHRPRDSYFRYGWTVPRAELEPTRLRYAPAVRRVATATSTPVVDCAVRVPADPALFLADGYHPNKAGSKSWRERLPKRSVRRDGCPSTGGE